MSRTVMTSTDVRKNFFEFFVARGHTVVPSSCLIPAQDPTLLFANAGMNQFKDIFTGLERRSYTRAVSIQKCIRAGGKHNDLENVGFTARHLTFFQMMGNFSFGDYFKADAIRFAWDYLTIQVGLSRDILWASVHERDDESYDLWRDMIGLPTDRIVRLGDKDNFWSMGDVGPCGPCSEIYVDRGISIGCGKKSCAPGCECDRFLEIWNLVFMQYERRADGTQVPLEHPGVDTGMGLERLCMVIQGAPSVYETDVFAPLIQTIESTTDIAYTTASDDQKAAFRVLCDHARSVTMAISDGGIPAADGRGYVIRKIIRRAALFAQKLGGLELLSRVCDAVIAHMGMVYPEIITTRSMTLATIQSEVDKFWHQLEHGRSLLLDVLPKISGTLLSGDIAFKLYDTYGFPLELTVVLAHQYGYTVDRDGFEIALEAQRLQSGKKLKAVGGPVLPDTLVTEFVGYEQSQVTTPITGLLVGSTLVDKVPEGQQCVVITAITPLYVECGGQIDDTATLVVSNVVMPVIDVIKYGSVVGAVVESSVALCIGQEVTLVVDMSVRAATMKNHTATHLLQAALQEIVPGNTRQAGSYVGPDYLRFDVSLERALTSSDIDRVEQIVNTAIQRDLPVTITYSTYDQAIKAGVTAFFGDKYNPERVRVVSILGDDRTISSAELCGGTHVSSTGQIGMFKITEQTALSAGVRRIVAVTGLGALKNYQDLMIQSKQLASDLKVTVDLLVPTVGRLIEQNKQALNEHRKLSIALAQVNEMGTLTAHGLQLVMTRVPQISPDISKEYSERIIKLGYDLVVIQAQSHQNGLIPFVLQQNPKTSYDMASLKAQAKVLGIKGGGNPTSFQGLATPEQFEQLIVHIQSA